MSLIDKIENMQKKPDHIKRRVLFASVFIIMFIIAAAWISTLKVSLGEQAKEKSISSPFSVFKDMIGETVSKTSDGIADIMSNFGQNDGTEQ